MGLTKLGSLIEQIDVRNDNGNLGEGSVRGLSTKKQIIETKADLRGVNLLNYKVFPSGSFAYVPDTSRRGDKISLAYNREVDAFLVSSISVVFIVKDTEKLDPDYLFMYFNRPEFDRYARFNSWGSTREPFSWEDMCDIDIELPPLSVQKKYAAAYNSMLANQKSYERGLEDLREICDAHFDESKKQRTVPLGEIIEPWDLKNEDNEYGFESVRGINNKKEFGDTKADVTSTDLSKFLVIKKDVFAYNARTDGRDMLVIALNRDNDNVIVTWNYNAFRVKENAAKEVNNEYLYAFFKREEFDRRVRFMSWGSSQELLSWNNLCDIPVPLPERSVQDAIANINEVYLKRKSVNEILISQIKDLCPVLIKGSLEEGVI